MFDRLLVESVVVEPRPTGPEVKWNLPWREGWIIGDRIRGRHDLPDGIVGLLTLALVEYSSLLQEISAQSLGLRKSSGRRRRGCLHAG